MNNLSANKQIIRDFIGAVWAGRDLAALSAFWTQDCLNHAIPGPDNRGLSALRAYHQQFFADFAAFSNVRIEIVQQVEESDRVVTQLITRGEQRGEFYGKAPTGKGLSLSTIRIDLLRGGKIAVHWSVADLAGMMHQLQT